MGSLLAAVRSLLASLLATVLSLLATFLGTPEGQAYKWALIIEGTSIGAEVLQKGIERQHAHPKEFPLSPSLLIEIGSVQWELIFLGFGTLIGSFLAAPRTRRDPNALLGPYVVVLGAVIVVEVLYLVGPWLGSPWTRVVLANIIGLFVIYYCVTRAARVRAP